MRRLLLLAVIGVPVLGIGATGAVAAVRITATPPAPRVSVVTPPTWVPAPGTPPPVAVADVGGMDLEAGDGSRLAAFDPDTPRPTGSVAKTMTALAVLRAHPLGATDTGPVLTMTADDAALYRQAIAEDGSAVPVTAGERLSERDLLLALLLPSANNLAETLGRWVSGSHDAFVAVLNQTAASLGMQSTHFDDPSGFSPRTVSTPADLVRLGRAALADPALAALVATQQATLPDGTVLHNIDALLGAEPGWLGIKTGETPSAGGCLLYAARRDVEGAGGSVLLIGAVLGQPDLASALTTARRSVQTAAAGYVGVDLADPPPVDGSVAAPWDANTGLRVDPAAGGPLVVRRGAAVPLSATADRVRAPVHTGDRVGTLVALFPDGTRVRWTVVAEGEVPGPDWWWRLQHG